MSDMYNNEGQNYCGYFDDVTALLEKINHKLAVIGFLIAFLSPVVFYCAIKYIANN